MPKRSFVAKSLAVACLVVLVVQHADRSTKTLLFQGVTAFQMPQRHQRVVDRHVPAPSPFFPTITTSSRLCLSSKKPMQNSRPTDIALRESASEENSVDDVGMSISSQASQIKMSQHDTKFLASSYGPHFGTFDSISLMASAAAIGLIALNAFPESASAASSSSTNASVWLNALVAYGHYLFLLAMTALVTYERATVKANMSMDTEKSLVIADAAYGLTSVLLFVTGYLRVTEYGKGWNFYSHEPFFWLKLSALGVLAGLSLFPTIVLVRRGQALFANTDSNDDDNNNNRDQTKGGSSLQLFEPMSERLAGRMRKVMNAELTALATIPLMATCMARGIGYAEWFPWQAGAALTAVSLFGSSFVYARQALTWKEVEE